MRQAAASSPIFSDDLLKAGVQVALYYGFKPVGRIENDINETARTKNAGRRLHLTKSALDPVNAEHHHALRTYMDKGFDSLSKPVLFYHSNVEGAKRITKDDSVYLGLQAIGSRKSIAEALVIKAALDLLHDMKVGDICIHINTIGDKDSVARYSRELGNYFRKNISDVPAAAQALLRKDPLQCLRYLHKKEHPLYDGAPQSMEFLSEASRKHLREILEYLETIDVPYVIDKSLVGTSDYRPETLFEIRSFNEEDYDPTKDTDPTVYARGCRYDDLSKKMYRTHVPGAGVIFEARKRGVKHNAILNPQRIRQPKVHFIQFGFDAKLKSLMVIEALRKAKIPIYQSLGNDRLTHQLEIAERLGTPYTVIMGQKEVLDDTVIIRHMESRSQEIVRIEQLPEYLKSIK
jgi:histidyl-tRNA synthetase